MEKFSQGLQIWCFLQTPVSPSSLFLRELKRFTFFLFFFSLSLFFLFSCFSLSSFVPSLRFQTFLISVICNNLIVNLCKRVFLFPEYIDFKLWSSHTTTLYFLQTRYFDYTLCIYFICEKIGNVYNESNFVWLNIRVRIKIGCRFSPFPPYTLLTQQTSQVPDFLEVFYILML